MIALVLSMAVFAGVGILMARRMDRFDEYHISHGPTSGLYRMPRQMTDYPIYCTAQTYRGSHLEPSEWCETEVASEGDLCGIHDADAHAEDDYERYLQDKED